MPSVTSVIDTVLTPPLAALQQVLDTNGPFGAGDYAISSFHTDGAFLLPAGDYDVGGTYGVLVVGTILPGKLIGFNGIVGGQDKSEDYFFDRIAQVVTYHQLPITGYYAPLQRFDVHYVNDVFLWSAYIGSGEIVGLHVFPNMQVDLYWLCVL